MPVNEILIGAGTTAFGALLSWWLTNLASRRSEAEADRAATRMQADALIVAVYELRGLASANKVLWEGRAARTRTFLQAVVAAGGGTAQALLVAAERDREGWLPLVAGFGAMADVVGGARLASSQAAAAMAPVTTRIITAAAPLLRHSDPQVVAATETLTAAVGDQVSAVALDAALRNFGRVVARSLQPQPRRFLPGRQRPVVGGDGGDGPNPP